MRPEDIDQIMSIEEEAFATPWSRQAFESELEPDSKACYMVACDGNTVLGYMGAWFIVDEAHITNIAIHFAHRRRGIGNSLISSFVSYCAARGLKRMTLEVRVSNEAAIGLYKKHGFRALGLRKAYYSDNNEDAYLMWKELTADADE